MEASPEGDSSILNGGGAIREIKRLARLLSETDEETQCRQFREELGIDDISFLTVLRRSGQVCRRGVLLYHREGEVAVSFNGGKDACVVLYLWLAALLAAKGSLGEDDGLDSLGSRSALYFDSSEEFPEVRDFVNWTVKELGLSMAKVVDKSFRQGMGDLVAGGLRAVVMGQRRCDPWMADVDAYSPSSDGWPPFMRINPILDWSYSHVWMFLRAFSLPYCRLYDDGYTSLGSVPTTFRNPTLQNPDGAFSPAWQLEDAALERAGRVSTTRPSPEMPSRQPPSVDQAISAEKAEACIEVLDNAMRENHGVSRAGLREVD